MKKKCPKCGSYKTRELQKIPFNQDNEMKNNKFKITFSCNKCNNFWSDIIEENNNNGNQML